MSAETQLKLKALKRNKGPSISLLKFHEKDDGIEGDVAKVSLHKEETFQGVFNDLISNEK